jgi:hypothetical protein
MMVLLLNAVMNGSVISLGTDDFGERGDGDGSSMDISLVLLPQRSKMVGAGASVSIVVDGESGGRWMGARVLLHRVGIDEKGGQLGGKEGGKENSSWDSLLVSE